MLSSSLIFSLGVISMKVNPAFVSILIIAISLAIHTPVHSYLAITLALRRSELGSFHGPHTFSKVSSPVVMGRSHPPSSEMLQCGSKILYHHVDYGRDHCHWSHRKRELRYTPRNLPSHFLCLELLRRLSSRLIAPPTPTLFGVFAFHNRRSPFITGVCTPSIRCLCNNLSFHPCMHWKGPRLLSSSRAHETSCCTQLLHSLYSELHLGKLLLLAPIVSLQYLVESRVLLHNLHVPSCNFCSPDFSLFLAYVW